MAHLSSREALQFPADFALKAEYMRADDAADFQIKADLYETASRVAFLRARVIASLWWRGTGTRAEWCRAGCR